MSLVVTPKNVDISVKKAIQQIARKLGPQGSPTFAGLTLTDLVASRLIAAGSGKVFESVSDLTAWIAGTTNQITVTSDGDGTITLSTPQDIHVDAHMELAGLTIKDSDDNIIFYVDDDEMYFIASAVIEIADGMPIGLSLIFTYKT